MSSWASAGRSAAVESLHLSAVTSEVGARPHPRKSSTARTSTRHVFVGIYGQKAQACSAESLRPAQRIQDRECVAYAFEGAGTVAAVRLAGRAAPIAEPVAMVLGSAPQARGG